VCEFCGENGGSLFFLLHHQKSITLSFNDDEKLKLIDKIQVFDIFSTSLYWIKAAANE
jgi:hypothetical protein